MTDEINDKLTNPNYFRNTHDGKIIILCPFHKEKTPSFFIDLIKQKYYCLSCGVEKEFKETDYNKWINVKDKLPSYEDVYLTCDASGNILIRRYHVKKNMFDCSLQKDRKATVFSSITTHKYITHWMKIPLPPK